MLHVQQNSRYMYAHTHVHTQAHAYNYPITEYLKWSGMVLSQSNNTATVPVEGSRICTCTCNLYTTFSIMQLGSDRGVGVAIAKAAATEQQDCGTCINWESAYLLLNLRCIQVLKTPCHC